MLTKLAGLSLSLLLASLGLVRGITAAEQQKRQGDQSNSNRAETRGRAIRSRALKRIPMRRVSGGKYPGVLLRQIPKERSGPAVLKGPYRPALDRGTPAAAPITPQRSVAPYGFDTPLSNDMLLASGAPVVPVSFANQGQNLDFAQHLDLSNPPNLITGRETTAASAGDVVFMTGNWFAAFSNNGGNSFTFLKPWALFPNSDGGFCCDQVVRYVPQINRFIWVLLYMGDANGRNRIRIAAASPSQVVSSGGTAWATWDITPGPMGNGIKFFDFPDLNFGSNMLYLTANVFNGRVWGFAVRFPLAQIAAGSGLSGQFMIDPNAGDLKIVQNVDTTAYFADFKSDSQLRIFTWNEGSSIFLEGLNQLNIATVPTLDFVSLTPEAKDWLLRRAVPRVTGATKTGDQIWLAWYAGRSTGRPADNWPQPHIEMAVVDARTLTVMRQEYIWNSDFAFTYPVLATNAAGEVGISLTFGGGRVFPSHAVGILTNPRMVVATVFGSGIKDIYDNQGGGGADYMSIVSDFPHSGCFAATGWIETTDPDPTVNYRDAPQYVLFSRLGLRCRTATPPLRLLVHLQNIGDRQFVQNEWAGTKGEARRLEGFSLRLETPVSGLHLEYMAHLQNIGDTKWLSEGVFCGTRGQSRRLEGIAIRLTGAEAANYRVVYQVHTQAGGDSKLCEDGEFCGTRGESRRVEAMRVWVVRR